ncbi:MAG TPA: hypothetical protein DDX98_13565 [Bacteroidales bacterium]|jgi:hypothetical protein|nr:hypothetical protein [Bacteroidales bacterium]
MIYVNYSTYVNGTLQLSGYGQWVAFFFFSFFIGHVISFFAEKIDKSWSTNTWIKLHDDLWHKAMEIRNRIGHLSDSKGISIYQWCRSVLIATSPEAMADINRIIAPADFFRNLYVVFPITGILSFFGSNYKLGILFIILTVLSLYISQVSRKKLHKRICYHIIVLNALNKLKPEKTKD